MDAPLDFHPITVDFGGTQEVFQVGKAATAVPGSIALIFSLHEAYGTIPLSELFSPAMELAKRGVVVNDFQYEDWELLEDILRLDPKAKDIYFKDDQLRRVGERMYMPGFADFLDYLAREGRNAFYQGEVAQKIVRDYQQGGGFLRMEDLRDYQIVRRKPLQFTFGEHQILTNPLPSTGGSILALASALGSSIQLPKDYRELKHLEELHQLLEQLAKIPKQKERLQKELERLQQIQQAPKASQNGHQNGQHKKWGSTSHFNIVDQWGNAISLSTTNGEGCGYFVEGTDIQLNNMLGESALLPNGFHSWSLDERLSSMMAPTMLLNDKGRAEVVLGSGGASRIPGAIFQVLLYLSHYGLDVEAAVNAPRLHLEHGDFNQEVGFPNRLAEEQVPQRYIRWDKPSLFFGGVHTIVNQKGRLLAAGDQRRDGVAFVADEA